MLRSTILMNSVLFVILGLTPLSIGQTVNPADQFLETGQLSDPNLEARAVALGRTLRCVVCANQSIEDSEVEMAQTLRRFVRERLSAGKTEDDIRAELIRSYGQFVSYEPATTGFGWLLWVSPWLVLMIAGGAIFLAQQKAASSCIVRITSFCR